MIKKSVSIIIPNYNGKHLLEDYLPYTIQAIENAGVDYEIIVVDDASKDDSVMFIETQYPQIILLKNEKNKGFSGTCNVGMLKASKELMLFLNSDIKLSPDYFDNQWQCFEDENTFGTMGRIIDANPKVKDGPRLPKIFGLKYRIHDFFEVKESRPVPTAFLSGANALVCSKKMKILGGFNEIFSPFYYEDTELIVRVLRLGWNCYHVNQSICNHLGSSTINANHLRKNIKIVFYRNRYLMHGLHLTAFQFQLFKFQTLILEVIPKTLIGRFWIWESFLVLSKFKAQINEAKLKLEHLAEVNGTLISIFALRKKIINLLKQQNFTIKS